MKTFTYVEEYLEVINGDRDPITGRLYGLFNTTPPIVSLARYDVNILASMSDATQNGRALTDKQADLAVKLILKYRKQLEKNFIDVSPVEQPKFKLGIRQIDRRKLLTIEDDKIVLKFPYETTLINDLRELAKESQGQWTFNGQTKTWNIALTELNVYAVNGFAQNNKFEIDKQFQHLNKLVIDCEAVPYQLKLVEKNNNLLIENAPAPLLKAVENFCRLDHNNIDKLVDCSPIYGYEIDSKIQNDLCTKYSPRIYNLMTNKECKLNPTVDSLILNDIIKYAQISDRYPIYVYEPDMSDRLYDNFVSKYFTQDEILKTQTLKKNTINGIKCVYFNKFHSSWESPIPLLISSHGMMHGGEKTLLIQQSQKIIYFTTEVFSRSTTKVVKNVN